MFTHSATMISPGGHLTILESVDSTNNYAMARVRRGAANHGDAYFAMAQINGKGQRGKTWITERGTNIIITLVLRPGGLLLARQFGLSMAISLAAHDFFAGQAGKETSIKWPNDIYWRDRKAGGILIENIVTVEDQATLVDDVVTEKNSSSWQWAIAGIGININQVHFSEAIYNAVSLQQITGKDYNVIELADALYESVHDRFRQLRRGDDLLAEYNQRLYKKNQLVKFRKESRVFDGTVKGVDAYGRLLVQTSVEEQFDFGEVEWILK